MQFNGLNLTALATDIADSEAVTCNNCDLSSSLQLLTPPTDPFSEAVTFQGSTYAVDSVTGFLERDGVVFYQDPPSSGIVVTEDTAGVNGSIAQATYDFIYTLEDANGHESIAVDPVTHILATAGKKLKLAWTTGDIPADWKLNIYAKGGAAYFADYVLLHTVETTEADYTNGYWFWEGDSDLDAQNGSYSSEDHYTPPGSATIVFIHNSVMFLAKDETLYYSKVDQFEAYPTNYVFGFDGDITGLASINGELIVSTATEMTRISGYDNSDFRKLDTSVKKGCIRSKTFTQVKGSIVYVGSDGLYEFNGQHETKVSEKVNSLFSSIGAGIASNWDGRYYSVSNGIRLDILRGNWMNWDSTGAFTWKSKEYLYDMLPKKARRLLVDFVGDITLKIYYDSTLKHTYSLSEATRPEKPALYYMPSGRFERVQLEFSGTSAQLYSWSFWGGK